MIRKIIKHLIPPAVQRRMSEKLYQAAQLHFTLLSGVRVEILSHVDWAIYNDIFVDGEYDRPIAKLIEQHSSDNDGLKVLDLGANVGFFVLRLLDRMQLANSKLRASVTAVEPDRRNAAELVRRFRWQAGGIQEAITLDVIPALAGLTEGAATLYAGPQYHANTVNRSQRTARTTGQRVEYIDLEAAFPGVCWDLIKCDIEGSEGVFVRNYAPMLARARIFVVEVHEPPCDVREVRDAARKAGLLNEVLLTSRPGNFVYMYTRL